ncbi:MAG: hypothetical protein ACTSRI_15660 [Promethearchaeota archaeon]
MTTEKDKSYRKISRNFKGRIELMKRIPKEDAIKIFFEMCDFSLENYIKTERLRFPNKSIKEIIINMHDLYEKRQRRNKKDGVRL